MKIIKTASGNQVKMSKSEWESIGKTAGWITAENFRWDVTGLTPNPKNNPLQTIIQIADMYGKDVGPNVARDIAEYLEEKYNIDWKAKDLNDTTDAPFWDTVVHVILSMARDGEGKYEDDDYGEYKPDYRSEGVPKGDSFDTPLKGLLEQL